MPPTYRAVPGEQGEPVLGEILPRLRRRPPDGANGPAPNELVALAHSPFGAGPLALWLSADRLKV
jgi:hypothetical protein